jgi:hypothetical protein
VRVLTVVLLVIAAGCELPFGGGCLDETRNLSLGGTLSPLVPTAAITGTAAVSLHEARHHRTRQTSAEDFLWSVRASGIDRSTVSALHVHERDTDRLLFQIPIENTNAPLDVITQTFTRRPHNGAIAQWPEVYELLGSGRGYLDVHVGSGTPVLRADLTVQNANWRDFIHADCS